MPEPSKRRRHEGVPTIREAIRPRQELRIAEMAAELGTTLRTLRYYEETGILVPDRSAANVRVYGPDVRRRAHQMFALRAYGLRQDDIRRIMAADPQVQSIVLASCLRARLRAIDIQRAAVAAALETIGTAEAPSSPPPVECAVLSETGSDQRSSKMPGKCEAFPANRGDRFSMKA